LCQIVTCMNEPDFLGLVTSAYHALYDLIQLRTHPLGLQLLPRTGIAPKEQGWQLHNLLLEAIHQLDPGAHAPLHSKEWRRHRLMLLRYVEGMDPQQVAEQLSISRRQYYREHATAIEATAEILRLRRINKGQPPEADASESAGLQRSEIDRASRSQRAAQLGEVVNGVLQLLASLVQEHEIQVETDIPHGLPTVGVNPNVLRQVILTILGAVATRYDRLMLCLTACLEESDVYLHITVSPPVESVSEIIRSQLLPYEEILRSNGVSIDGLDADESLSHVTLALPCVLQKLVLVIDDNKDVLELFERYLVPNHYQVQSASDAESALALATRLKPALIIVDLMMPQIDGWELLRRFRLDEQVAHIPIVICSVLKQRELALALGAQDFIEKPITEERLLSAVSTLLE
jgi:CheY-like chemotaxis protein